MSDVRAILASSGAGAGAGAGSGAAAPAPSGSRSRGRASAKPKGMSREVYALVGQTGLVPIVRLVSLVLCSGCESVDRFETRLSHDSSRVVCCAGQMPTHSGTKAGFKGKLGNRKVTKWGWLPFTNSARRDGLSLYHWDRVKAEFDDYPFARFAKQSEIVRYTDDEYRNHLSHDTSGDDRSATTRWSKEETDHLFDLCRRFDLRWGVIVDRYELSPQRTTEDLKDRFYTVTARVLALRCTNERMAQTVNNSGLKAFANFQYNHKYERKRRVQLENMFARNPQQANEESMLLTELKRLDAAIKVMHVRTGKTERTIEGDEAWLGGFPATGEAVLPPKGTSLRSSMMYAKVTEVSVSNGMATKCKELLTEMGVPARPLPRPDVVESLTDLRLKTLAMLNLQKLVTRRRHEIAELQDRRVRLADRPVRRPSVSSASGAGASKGGTAARSLPASSSRRKPTAGSNSKRAAADAAGRLDGRSFSSPATAAEKREHKAQVLDGKAAAAAARLKRSRTDDDAPPAPTRKRSSSSKRPRKG